MTTILLLLGLVLIGAGSVNLLRGSLAGKVLVTAGLALGLGGAFRVFTTPRGSHGGADIAGQKAEALGRELGSVMQQSKAEGRRILVCTFPAQLHPEPHARFYKTLREEVRPAGYEVIDVLADQWDSGKRLDPIIVEVQLSGDDVASWAEKYEDVAAIVIDLPGAFQMSPDEARRLPPAYVVAYEQFLPEWEALAEERLIDGLIMVHYYEHLPEGHRWTHAREQFDFFYEWVFPEEYRAVR